MEGWEGRRGGEERRVTGKSERREADGLGSGGMERVGEGRETEEEVLQLPNWGCVPDVEAFKNID